MTYCFDHGIPYSEFMSWSSEDIERVLAFQLYKSEICPQCGTKDEDWVDDKGRALDEPVYEAATVRCFGCQQIETLRDSIPSGQKGVYTIAKRRQIGKTPEIILRREEDKARKEAEQFPTMGTPKDNAFLFQPNIPASSPV
jgi:hypothetical protein